ncbi:hypothetical protein I3842_16G025800 [Carya illinoinensis]|uniref:Uncharacterized protein n=1 Tax=Carya illinoinensis TaxID=32201 RepID=A0A922D465_CARIL|nr:hypothetical protein I3842_16G025800 [Carya illinoinensis]
MMPSLRTTRNSYTRNLCVHPISIMIGRFPCPNYVWTSVQQVPAILRHELMTDHISSSCTCLCLYRKCCHFCQFLAFCSEQKGGKNQLYTSFCLDRVILLDDS